MRLRVIAIVSFATPMLTSCGSSWDIRKGDELPIGCEESFFYQDADGDGWGDPDSEPQKLCAADVEQGLTASNGRDCDDTDPTITGLVGTSCPDGLVGNDGAPVPHAGVIIGEAEYAFVHGADAPVVRHGSAVGACAGWGGVDPETGEELGTLATFTDEAAIASLQGALEGAFEGTAVHAAFIGIEWDGSAIDDGSWSFVDNVADGEAPGQDDLISASGAFVWCDGIAQAGPGPEDFFPLLNPQDPDHVPAINAQLEELRLAMVLQEDGSWCLGLPFHAIPDDIWDELQAGTADMNDPFVADVARYTTSDGHLVCKRPKPNPEDYRHLVGADE